MKRKGKKREKYMERVTFRRNFGIYNLLRVEVAG